MLDDDDDDEELELYENSKGRAKIRILKTAKKSTRRILARGEGTEGTKGGISLLIFRIPESEPLEIFGKIKTLRMPDLLHFISKKIDIGALMDIVDTPLFWRKVSGNATFCPRHVGAARGAVALVAASHQRRHRWVFSGIIPGSLRSRTIQPNAMSIPLALSAQQRL